MNKYKILTLSGVTASGKTSIARELIQGSVDKKLNSDHEFRMLRSYTTRNHRDSDLPWEYAYLTEDEFTRDENSFLWTNDYGGARYGTKRDDLETALQADYTSIMILVPGKIEELYSYVPQGSVLSIFIETPPEEEVRRRLKERGGLSEEEIELRMKQNSLWEMRARKSSIPYRFIKNSRDGLDLAVKNILEYFN